MNLKFKNDECREEYLHLHASNLGIVDEYYDESRGFEGVDTLQGALMITDEYNEYIVLVGMTERHLFEEVSVECLLLIDTL